MVSIIQESTREIVGDSIRGYDQVRWRIEYQRRNRSENHKSDPYTDPQKEGGIIPKSSRGE